MKLASKVYHTVNGIKLTDPAMVLNPYQIIGASVIGLVLGHFPACYAQDTGTSDLGQDVVGVIETTLTPASRLEYRKRRRGMSVSGHQSNWQSQITGEHRWYDWAAVWQLQYQQRLDAPESHSERQLSELSWNPELSSQLSLRVGKFSQDIERSTLFQPLGFFQTPVAPFDSFASVNGLWMASLTWWSGTHADGTNSWLSDWVVTPMIARNSPTDIPATAGQRSIDQDRSPHQWGLALERDFNSLSTTLLAQQFQGQKPGLGMGYSWVSGSSWQLSGSAFVRQGSQYLYSYNLATSSLNTHIPQATSAMENPTEITNFPPTPEPFQNRKSGYYPRISQSMQWSGRAQTFTLELHYDRRKLSRSEQRSLYASTDSQISPSLNTETTAPSLSSDSDNTKIHSSSLQVSKAIRQLSEDRHQQRYLYGNYRWEDIQQQWSASVLVGADRSHWTQLRYTRYVTWSVSVWTEVDYFSGDSHTEFGRVPWQSVYRLGGQWVF